jgi:hypothetical protein
LEVDPLIFFLKNSRKKMLEDDFSNDSDRFYGSNDDSDLYSTPPSFHSRKRRTRSDTESENDMNPLEESLSLEEFQQKVSQALNEMVGEVTGCEYNSKLPRFQQILGPDRVKEIPHWHQNERIEAINDLPDGTWPVFHRMCHTVPMSAVMRFGSKSFNSWKMNEKNGNSECLAFMFYGMTFTDPSNGTNVPGKPYSHTFSVEGRIFPKVSVIFEPLVRRVTENDDALDGTIGSLDIVKLLNVNNIVAFRVWYLIHDPQIVPWQVVDQQIANLKIATGAIPNYKRYTIEDPEILLWKEEFNVEKMEKVVNEVKKRNANLEQLERRNQHLKKEFLKAKGTLHSTFYKVYQLTSRVAFYNFVQSYLLRCLKCYNSKLRCPTCRNKEPNFSSIETRDSIDYEAIRFDSIRLANPFASIAESDDLSSKMIRSIIDPLVALNPLTPTVMKLLKDLKISGHQARIVNYETDNHEYVFPWGTLTFKAPEVNMHHMNLFIESKLPWAYSGVEAMLHVIEEMTKGELNKRQRRHVQDVCGDIDLVPALRTIDQINTLYYEDESVFRPAIPESLISEELTEESFNGIRPIFELDRPEDSESRLLIRYKDDTDDYFNTMATNRERFQRLIPALERHPDITNHIHEQFKIEGREATLNILCSTNPRITAVMQNAAKKLESMERMRDTTSIQPIQAVDPDFSLFANHLINFMIYIESTGVSQASHLIILQLFHQLYRASHSSEIERLHGYPTDVESLVLLGRAATGKTMIVKLIQEHSVPGSIDSLTSTSEHSTAAAQNLSDTMVVSDELNASNDPRRAKGADLTKLTATKEALTSFFNKRQVLILNPDTSDPRLRRQTAVYEIKLHRSLLILANDLFILEADVSHWTRFGLNYTIGEPERKGGREGSSDTTPTHTVNVGTLNNSNKKSIRRNWLIILHAMHCFVAYGIKLGALSYPCMKLLGIYRGAMFQCLKDKFPNIERDPRIIGRMWSQAVSKTISFAISTAFVSEVNPRINLKTGELRPFQISDIFAVEPYLFCSTDIAIFELTHMVFQYMIPTMHYTIAHKVAVQFGHYRTVEPPPPEPGQKPPEPIKYRKFRDKDGELTDRNYICVGTYRTVSSWLCQNCGLNNYGVHNLFMFLTKLIMYTEDYIEPQDPSGRTRTRNKRINALLIDNLHTGPINTADNIDFSVFNDEVLSISVEYLRFCEPNHLLKWLMQNTFEYEFTQQRKVIVGDTIPLYPALFKTYTLNPNPGKSLRVIDTSAHVPSIHHALAPICSLSRYLTDISEGCNVERTNQLIFQEDPEIETFKEWFEGNLIKVPDGFFQLEASADGEEKLYEFFNPKNTNSMLRKLHRQSPVYRDSPRFTYPESYIDDINKADNAQAAKKETSFQQGGDHHTPLQDDSEVEQNPNIQKAVDTNLYTRTFTAANLPKTISATPGMLAHTTRLQSRYQN